MCKSDHGTDAACGGLGGYATISSASTHQVHNRRRNGTYNTGMLLSISLQAAGLLWWPYYHDSGRTDVASRNIGGRRALQQFKVVYWEYRINYFFRIDPPSYRPVQSRERDVCRWQSGVDKRGGRLAQSQTYGQQYRRYAGSIRRRVHWNLYLFTTQRTE